MKLEIGVGTTRYTRIPKESKYPFRPRLPGRDIIYADIWPPEDVLNLNDRFIVCDAQHMPFRDSAFDEIAASHLVEHLDRPLLFLRECYRILQLGGKVHIWCPNMQRKSELKRRMHKSSFSLFSLKRLMRAAGFSKFIHPPGLRKMPKILTRAIKLFYILSAYELYVIGIKG